MQSITFECEVITPMFLAGADGSTPELRPPSIKGALRFWWRALNGHLPLHELKEKEDEIFGGTDGRSKVILTTRYADENMTDENVPTFNYLRDYKENQPGVKYFNVPFFQYEDIKDREGIAPKVKFEVTLRSKDKSKLIKAANVFWVMSILGGLGTRSRRGDGAFIINKISRKSKKILYADLPFYYKNKGGKFQKGSIFSFKKLINLNETDASQSFSFLNDSQIFYSKGTKGFKNWVEAINDIAFKMMQIRDGDTIVKINRNANKFKTGDLDKKAAFGLPLGVRNEKDLLNLHIFNEQKQELEEARRASPLYISVTRVGKNYYWIVSILKGKFMPSQSKIKYKKEKWDREDPVLVKEFIGRLKNNWENSEDILEADLDAELEALKYGTEYKKVSRPKYIKSIKL